MAGFRIGRTRAQQPRSPQQNGGFPPPAPAHGSPGQGPGPGPTQGGYGQAGYGQGGYGQGGSGPSGYGRGGSGYRQQPTGPVSGEPEYFADAATDPYGRYGPNGPNGNGGPQGTPGSYDDAPGHTQTFSIGESPDAYDPQYGGGPYEPRYDDGNGNVSMYRAGQSSAPPTAPRLHWKELLSGIALRPGRTFWQMRDYQVWGPALLVTFIYGLLAVFGFDTARREILASSLSSSIPWVLSTAVAVVLSGVMMGAVTHALARQFGGDGGWAPTIGLAMLITSLTDAPRLFFALFLGGGNGLVQILGWATWLACAALLTSMVSKSHDLPWPKALGAASIQLIALLILFKLPTL